MYNQEIKERFLAEYTAGGRNENTCRSILELIGIYEEAIQVDIAEMSHNDAVEAVRGTKTGSYGSAAHVASLIKSYARWCKDSGALSNVNCALMSISVDDIDSSRHLSTLLFKSEDDLISEMRSVRPFDDGYFEVVVLLFAWLGIDTRTSMSIKIDDVNIEDKFIKIESDGRIVQFSDAVADVISVYAKTKVGTRAARGETRQVYRDNSYDRFIRKFCPPKQLGKELTLSQVRSAISEMNQIYVEEGNESRLNTSNVMVSGALHRVWTLEQSGLDVFSVKNKSIVAEAFGLDAKPYEVLWLYKNYKAAFNL